jgi:hypothetical protein
MFYYPLMDEYDNIVPLNVHLLHLKGNALSHSENLN